MIASDEQEYIQVATALALDRPRLGQLRAGLRERTRASPLMDIVRFTRHLEQAYRGMWERWCDDSEQAAMDNDAKGMQA